MSENKKKSIVKSVIIYVICAILIIGSVIFANSKSPDKSIFGYRFYTILTPSMQPAYNVGDLVVVKLSDAQSINVDDVITFMPDKNGEAYLTHRVVEKYDNFEGSESTCFKTKGDNNQSEDAFIIDESRLIGKVSLRVPQMGRIAKFVQLRWYFVVPIVIMVIVLLSLLKALRNSKKTPIETTDDNIG